LKQFPHSCYYIQLSPSLLHYSFPILFVCPFYNFSSRHTIATAEKSQGFSRILATAYCIFPESKGSRLFIRRSFTCPSDGDE
jgi:hypothetical protein